MFIVGRVKAFTYSVNAEHFLTSEVSIDLYYFIVPRWSLVADCHGKTILTGCQRWTCDGQTRYNYR
jgi:macrodomain Ter protein organizer (MatP/YcbG family)